METNLNPSVSESTIETALDSQNTASDSVENSSKKTDKQIVEKKMPSVIDVGKPETVNQCEEAMNKLHKNFQKIIKEFNPIDIQRQARELKKKYEEFHKKLTDLKKEKFVAEGGEVIDFKYNHPEASVFYDLLKKFQVLLKQDLKEREKQQLTNFEAKQQVIEDLKVLIDEDHHKGNIYQKFRLLQNHWQSIGDVPRDKYQEMWRIYHFHVERFYDLLHISNDLRDIDFKHNLDEKQKLIERAEALLALDDIHFAFKELQLLHKLWKEDTGPVFKEKREEIWERFSEITQKIHDKRHEFFKQRQLIEKENAEKKLTVISKIESIDTSTNQTNNDWQKSIKEFEVLRASFLAIGQVSLKEKQTIWNKFKQASRGFSDKKNNYYNQLKNQFSENLKKKQALLNQVIANKDSEDWAETTKLIKQLQATWRTIGKVPRNQSDEIWSAFKEACNHFFERLRIHQKGEEQKREEASLVKKQFLDELMVNNFETTCTEESIKELILKWFQFPPTSKSKSKIDVSFQNFILNLAEKQALNVLKIDFFMFTSLIKKLEEAKLVNEILAEKSFYKKRVSELSKEVSQLENNLSFFSKISSENSDFKKIKNDTDSSKERLKQSKIKLNFLEKRPVLTQENSGV